MMNEQYKKQYVDFLKKHLSVKRPLKVVFDASNGPTGLVVQDLFKDTLIDAIFINTDIDPDFKAHGANPVANGASDQCVQVIKEKGADLGVIFDADGDRAVFIDEKGEILHACFVAALLFSIAQPPYVADDMVYQSLRMLKVVPEETLLPSRIGAYFLKEKMREHKASCGGEYSGHFFFKDFFNVDSGIFTAVQVLNAFSRMNQSLSLWRASFGEHVIKAKEIKTAGKDMPAIYAKLEQDIGKEVERVEKRDGLTFIFKNFWINTRSSNTEPIMRIIGGGKEQEMATLFDRIVEYLK